MFNLMLSPAPVAIQQFLRLPFRSHAGTVHSAAPNGHKRRNQLGEREKLKTHRGTKFLPATFLTNTTYLTLLPCQFCSAQGIWHCENRLYTTDTYVDEERP